MGVLVVGIGGTVRARSSSETALRVALDAAAARGADVRLLLAEELMLPAYGPGADGNHGARLLTALRAADGLIVSTPGYHGGMSGLLKNALDYVEEMANDDRPYLDLVPVGCIAVARGGQGAVSALSNLRTVVHALRGFPTPYGAAVTLASAVPEAGWLTAAVRQRLELVGHQVYDLALALRRAVEATELTADADAQRAS
jgi:FMN reductase